MINSIQIRAIPNASMTNTYQSRITQILAIANNNVRQNNIYNMQYKSNARKMQQKGKYCYLTVQLCGCQ